MCAGTLIPYGQNLHLHPHVQCVVPGGGIALDRSRWIACRPGFFLPVAVMRRLFRGKFLALFHDAFRNGRLSFHGQQQTLADPALFVQMLNYLARYTNRVAISNHRLFKIEDGKVYFHWKDYAHGSVQKTLALDAVEFIRRFLQHVAPSGFVRIRHFGFPPPWHAWRLQPSLSACFWPWPSHRLERVPPYTSQ